MIDSRLRRPGFKFHELLEGVENLRFPSFRFLEVKEACEDLDVAHELL